MRRRSILADPRVRLILVAAAATFAMLCTAGPATASCRSEVRFIPDLSGLTGGSLGLVTVCDGPEGAGSKSSATEKKRSAPKKPTARQVRTLRYVKRASVSARVRDRMIGRLAHGPDAEAIRVQIASGDLMRQFDGAIGKLGWRTNDLVDMYEQAYIVMWLAVDPVRSTTSKKVDEAVRRDIRDKLALDAAFRRMSDAEQQELAEWLGSWTVVLAGSLNTITAQGDAARTAAYRQEVRRMVQRRELLGVDMTRVKLTSKGIERR